MKFLSAKLLIVMVSLFCGALSFHAKAQPGDLDPTFGVQRRQSTEFPIPPPGGSRGEPNAIVQQPDGKILVGGSAFISYVRWAFALARYNADGTPDASFGNNGVVRIAFSTNGYERAYCLALQPDGKIILGGFAYLGSAPSGDPNTGFALARYNPDGSLDTSFGAGGKVVTDLTPTLDEINEVLLQPDGKIVTAGFVTPGPTNSGFYDFAVVRYNADGSLDLSFGDGGHVFTDFAGGGDFAQSALLQPDGKIVLAGVTAPASSGAQRFGLARYLPDGGLDPAFGTGGKVVTDFGSAREIARSIKLAPDGKLVVVGDAYFTSAPTAVGQTDYALARYNPDGSLDTSFNDTGTLLRGAGVGGFNSENSEIGWDLVIQADNKILVAGQSRLFHRNNGSDVDIEVFRLNPNGTLDPSFGNSGSVLTDFGEVFFLPGAPNYGNGRSGEPDQSLAAAFQGDGKLIVAGSVFYTRSRYDFGVARYLTDAPVPAMQITGLSRLGNGETLLQGLGMPNHAHKIEWSSDLSAGSFQSLSMSAMADAAGVFELRHTPPANAAQGFYRLRRP